MKRENLDEDQLLSDLFQRSASLPGEALKSRILEKVTADKVPEYQPIISQRAWLMILSGIAGLLFFLFTYEGSASSEIFQNEWFTYQPGWELPSGLFKGWHEFTFRQLPLPYLASMIAMIVFGLYFMLSFKWFRKYLS